MTRQQELVISLRDILDLIETNQLVRNPMADHKPDWMERMVKFVQIIKRAQDLVAPDLKDPAKVMPIDGCRFHSAPEDAIAAPGGCVSVPDQQFVDNQKVLQTLSEKLQDELEPLHNEGKKFCV